MDNNLTLNLKKELIVDFRRHRDYHSLLTIRGEEVERVTSF